MARVGLLGAMSSLSPAAETQQTFGANRLSYRINEWRVTTRPGKLYFIFFQEPRVPFDLPPMKNSIQRAYTLVDHKPVEIRNENGRRQLNVPRPAPFSIPWQRLW